MQLILGSKMVICKQGFGVLAGHMQSAYKLEQREMLRPGLHQMQQHAKEQGTMLPGQIMPMPRTLSFNLPALVPTRISIYSFQSRYPQPYDLSIPTA